MRSFSGLKYQKTYCFNPRAFFFYEKHLKKKTLIKKAVFLNFFTRLSWLVTVEEFIVLNKTIVIYD